MKVRQWLFVFPMFLLVLSATAYAQSEKKEAEAKPAYDAELAKKLGADERGMRRYVLAILRTGPNDAKITDKDKRAELGKGHFAMINRLADEGKLVMAGPFNDEKNVYRGLYIFNVETIEEARRLTETDPSIKAGMFEVELIKWYGSAGLMEMNDIHKRITPPGK